MREINVGMIGAGFAAKAHSVAYRMLPTIFWPPPAIPRLKVIADIDARLAELGAKSYGFQTWTVEGKSVAQMKDIELVNVATPNNAHREACIEAAEHGKHVFCEKPMAMNAIEAKEMYESAEKADVKHCVDFNYRKTPAVSLAKQLVDENGIGRVYHFRAAYLQDWPINPDYPLTWRFRKDVSGSGVLGDLGSHIIDLARFLVGDIKEVASITETFVKERPLPKREYALFETKETVKEKGKVDVDDAACILARFENGALGTIESSRLAYGRKNYQTFELYGSKGSLIFNYERLNELKFYSAEDPEHTQGFRTILTGPAHPYGAAWGPIPGISEGYMMTIANTIYEFLNGIVNEKKNYPTFYDGWKSQQVIDASLKSAATGRWVSVG